VSGLHSKLFLPRDSGDDMGLRLYRFAAILQHVVRVEFHPEFAKQYVQVCADDDLLEVAGEITMLIDALERYGHEIEGSSSDDPSHPIVSSRLAMFCLRRTPPTTDTPYAINPPVIRIPYVWFLDNSTGEQFAVVMLMGDKTELHNHWYPTKVIHIENLLVPSWERANPSHAAIVRRTR
jgi:hypothetical protein